jgi:hypothetical protein
MSNKNSVLGKKMAGGFGEGCRLACKGAKFLLFLHKKIQFTYCAVIGLIFISKR